jgi:hypothetical protein
VPHPPEVVGQRAKAVELRGNPERGAGLSGDADGRDHMRRDHTGGAGPL